MLATFDAIGKILAARMAVFVSMAGLFVLSLITLLEPTTERMTVDAIYAILGMGPVIYYAIKKG